MVIRVNGKEKFLENSLSILNFIKYCDLDGDKIIVEHNSVIIPQEKWAEVLINDADVIEIVSFVGGG